MIQASLLVIRNSSAPRQVIPKSSTYSRLLSQCTLAHKGLFLTAPVSRFTSKVYTRGLSRSSQKEKYMSKGNRSNGKRATGNRQRARVKGVSFIFEILIKFGSSQTTFIDRERNCNLKHSQKPDKINFICRFSPIR